MKQLIGTVLCFLLALAAGQCFAGAVRGKEAALAAGRAGTGRELFSDFAAGQAEKFIFPRPPEGFFPVSEGKGRIGREGGAIRNGRPVVGAAAPEEGAALSARTGGFRGVWVSTVFGLDYPSAAGQSAQALRREADDLLNRVRELGFDAVIFQVRPSADAFYPSGIFPWSRYLSGRQGEAPAGFDPLGYFTETAHELGLELHAWVNPYRVTASLSETLCPWHPALIHPEWTVRYGEKLYFDPGQPGARELVIGGVREILERYPVDGIHLDDYFYPGRDFDDGQSYAAYGGGLPLADWRRQNNDELIRELSDLVRTLRPEILFGVSPCGIWANRGTHPEGSETSGYEAFSDVYADTRGWVKKGWLDYIAPQIYFPIGHKAAAFEVLIRWWADTVRGTGVRLYVGQAVYRADAWGIEELVEQAGLIRTLTDGCIMFRLAFLTEEWADYAAWVNRELWPPSSPDPPRGCLARSRAFGSPGFDSGPGASRVRSLAGFL